MKNFKPNIEILQDLEEYVEGHIEAKKALISLVNRSKWRHHQKFGLGMFPEYLLAPSKILLLGASGTGKTHLVESLHKIISFPLVRVDATQFNPTGASGGVKMVDLQDMILDEAKLWVNNQKYAGAEFSSVEGTVDQTVVFVDEIDKLGRSYDSSGSWNKHVQSSFLTMFDNKAEFAGVSFIFAGAFSDITGEPAKKNNQIGFSKHEELEKEKDYDDLVVKAGLIPELVGRLTNICALDKFTEDDFYNVLVNRLVPKKQIDLAAMGIFDSELIEERARAIAKHACTSGQGIRALQRSLEKEYLDIEFNYEDDRMFIGYDQV